MSPRRCISRSIRLLAPAFAISLFFGQQLTAYSQAVPDAGRILHERMQPPAPGMLPPPPAGISEPRMETPDDNIKITVTAFEFSGNTAIPDEELQELVAEQLGRRLGLGELRNVAIRITALYRERGYPVARAYLPAQDIKDGRVAITILEGNFAKIQLRNASSLSDERALAYFNLSSG